MKDTTRRVLALIATVYILSQILPITRMVYWPSKVGIEKGQVTLVRYFPGDTLNLPRPRISYVETVTPLSGVEHNGGQFCQDTAAAKKYTSKREVGQWDITPWAKDCLSDPLGYKWSASWTWHLGVFTFGSTSLNHTVLK